ncbi:MAG: hypothetical protein RL318_1600 [Fibrobacterota bacterium]
MLHQGCADPPGEDPRHNRYSSEYSPVPEREELAKCLERKAQDRHALSAPDLVLDSLTRVRDTLRKDLAESALEQTAQKRTLDSLNRISEETRAAIELHDDRTGLLVFSLCLFLLSCAFCAGARHRLRKRRSE